MSNQDDISALLASVNAEAAPSDTAQTSAPSPSPEPAPAPVRKARPTRDNGDVLGVSWLFGALHAAVFRRQKMVKEWTSRKSVPTMEEFAPALDEALAELEFGGTEMFLILENEQFSHQPENAPLAPAAAKVYLQKRVERFEKEHEPMLWVAQPTVAVRQEQSYLLHLLPGSFYDQLNRVLLERRLDLTRILPLVVPLHKELQKVPLGKDTPLLLVADVGESTVLTVGRVGGALVFYRTILAALGSEAARVGVEANRSLLYAKQQYGCALENIWVFARNGKSVSHLQAKCGADKKIVVLPTTPIDWLQTAAKLPARQPINLLAGYFRRKYRRAVVRLLLIAACWATVAGLAVSDVHVRRTFESEKTRLAELQARESELLQERDRLTARNASLETDRVVVQKGVDERVAPVPSRFLALLADVLPDDMRLSEAQVKLEGAEAPAWTFRIEGFSDTDSEGTSALLSVLQGQLERSPLRVRFEQGRGATARPSRITAGESQRFLLQGGLLE